MAQLAFLDWAIVFAYFVAIFAVALWAYRKQRGDETPSGYFLGGRNIGWFIVGASLFVSNIGSEHLIGLSGTAADSGLAVGQFEVMASLILLLLGWVFVPFYIRSGVFTMPEFLERRYSSAARWYLSIISIVGYVLTKISVTLYAGGIVFQTLMGIDFWTGALIVVVFTGVYTVFGGLRAVVYTDLAQMFVLLIGSITVTILGLARLGGWGEMTAAVPDGFMSVWRPMTDESFPWTGILLGAPILAVWYWCTDQFIVQRTLAARDDDHARRGTIFAGYLKLLPLFIFVIPGVIAYALVQQGEIQLDQADQALPALVSFVLPIGVRGLVVAGLLAALMSSLSSVFNSTSTLFTWDIYRELRPQASDRHLVWVGRVATASLTVIGLAWIPFMQNISPRLYEYLQSVQAYIAPPIAAVFLLGIAWQRVNASGAMASLLTGFVIGASRLVLELVHGAEQQGLAEGSVWALIAEFNFLHFAVVLFVICVAVLVGVSLATEPPGWEHVSGLTHATAEEPVLAAVAAGDGGGDGRRARAEPAYEPVKQGVELEETPDIRERPRWRRIDLVLTIGLAICVILVWAVFTG
jgi:solute:Na+ symporter, SSS family